MGPYSGHFGPIRTYPDPIKAPMGPKGPYGAQNGPMGPYIINYPHEDAHHIGQELSIHLTHL